MSPEETMFQEALAALEKGDKKRAQDLLTRLIKVDTNKADYWLWLSAAVKTQRERVFCLKEALRCDPQNVNARRGLIAAGELPVDPALVMNLRQQKRTWRAEPIPGSAPPGGTALPLWRYIIVIAIAGLALAALLAFGFFGPSLLNLVSGEKPVTTIESEAYLPSITPSPFIAVTITPVLTGPAPLWMQLSATYTLTPTYNISTPHAYEDFRSGMRAYGRGDWAAAITSFQKALTTEPGAADIWHYIGEANRQMKNYPSAMTAFNKAVQLNDHFAPAYLGRGRTRLAAEPDKWKDAQADLEMAASLDPKLVEAFYELAGIDLANQDGKAALTHLNAGSVQAANSPLLYLYRARAYLLLNQPDLALQNAQRANQMDVTMLDVYRVLGQAWIANNNPAEAAQPLRTYLTYVTDNAAAYTLAGKAYAGSQNADFALDAFSQAIQLDNRQLDAYLGRGAIYLAREDGVDALSDFNNAVNLAQDSFEAILGKGRALLLNSLPGDAYMQFIKLEALIKTPQQRAQMLYWRAQSLEQIKDAPSNRAAINDWQALLALPAGSAPDDWLVRARQRLMALVTSTPTLLPSYTPTPTATPMNTATRGTTETPTPAITPTVSRSPTVTLFP